MNKNFFILISRRSPAALLAAVLLGLAGCLPDREPTAPIETDRPVFNALTPAEGALVVSVNTPVTMVFNEKMDPASFANHFTLTDCLGADVAGTMTAVETTIVFRPSQPLADGMIYRATMKGRVRDVHQNSIGLNGDPVLNDTSVLATTWFFTEGNYSRGGAHRLYVRDTRGSIRVFGGVSSLIAEVGRFGAPQGMALSTDGQLLFVSSTNSDSVAVINTALNSIIRQIPTASFPTAIAASGTSVYVVCVNAPAIQRINTATLAVEQTFSLGFYPGALAVSPDGQTLYTIDQVTLDLVLLRTSNGTIIKRVAKAVTSLVQGELKVQPGTGTLFIPDSRGHVVKTFDPAGTAFTQVQKYATTVNPLAVDFGTSAYLVAAGKSLYKYDAASHAQTGVINFANNVKSAVLLPTGELIYATVNMSVMIIDMRTMTLLKEIPLSSSGIESIISSPGKF